MDIRNSRFFVLFFGWAHPPLFLSDCSLQSATENAFPQSHSSSSGPHPSLPHAHLEKHASGYGNMGCGVFKQGNGGTKLEIFLPKNQYTVFP